MKKTLFITILSLLSLVLFCSCPTGDSLENYTCLTADELVEKMNNANFGTSFTLKNSKSQEKSNYKYTYVELECSEITNGTLWACNFISYDSFSYIVDYENFADKSNFEMNTSTARTTFFSVQNEFVTNFYALKYQEEIKEHFVNLFADFLNDSSTSPQTEYEYKILVKYNAPYYSEFYAYQNSDEFLEKSNFSVYTLIKRQVNTSDTSSSSFTRKFNAFCYDLSNSTNYADSSSQMYFYFSPNYTPPNITDEALINGNFFTKGEDAMTYLTYGN